MVARGACMVAPGGVCGCSWGRVWLLPGGHAWLLLGGVRGCSWGGMCRIRRDTVNERAVHILLECILVFVKQLC